MFRLDTRTGQTVAAYSAGDQAPADKPDPLDSVDGGSQTMHMHRMVRTQLYPDTNTHRRRQLAERQGRKVSDLVREAVARVYGPSETDARISTLEGISGLWQDRADLGVTDACVIRLRRDTRRKRTKA